ncbi:MAG: hypothetical protein Q7V17_13760 [Afipia sp.]|nr:hypothetical protein [Afipia sp.]
MGETEESIGVEANDLDKLAPLSFAEFLEGVPPSQKKQVVHLVSPKTSKSLDGTVTYELMTPQLQLHCTSDDCNGLRFFRYARGEKMVSRYDNTYLTYICSNCRSTPKIFSLNVHLDQSGTWQLYKYGELPAFGPMTPPRLLKLLGDQREIFLKGRRCENQGLGVGAFGYYRRVVENQKNRILDEIIKVSEKLGATAEALSVLHDAKKEIQFSKSVASVKNAIPQALLINGHNPLTLLHSALSVGLHEQTDERCLELAHDVRVVLAELSERLTQALKDEAELNSAVSRLFRARD